MNLLSAILVAGAAGRPSCSLRRLDVPLPVAVAAALGLALTPITWAISAAADAHALHLLLLALLVLALVRWERLVEREATRRPGGRAPSRPGLVLAAGVFGVALGNHALTLLLVPAIGAVRARGRPRRRSAGAGLVARLRSARPPASPRCSTSSSRSARASSARRSSTATPTRGRASGRSSSPASSRATSRRRWRASRTRSRRSRGSRSPSSGLLAVLVPARVRGHRDRRFPRYALLSGVATGVTCLFAASYLNADIDRYYLGPALFAWSWLAIAAGILVGARRPTLVAGDADAGRAVAAPTTTRSPRPPPAGSPPSTTSPGRRARLLSHRRSRSSHAGRAVDRSDDTVMARLARRRDDRHRPRRRRRLVLDVLDDALVRDPRRGPPRPTCWIVDDSDIVVDDLGSVEDVIDANLGRRPVLVIRATPADLGGIGRTLSARARRSPRAACTA